MQLSPAAFLTGGGLTVRARPHLSARRLDHGAAGERRALGCHPPFGGTRERRTHAGAGGGWVWVVVLEGGSAGAGAGVGSGWLRLGGGGAACGRVSARRVTFSRTVERRGAGLSASWAVSAAARAGSC